MNLLTALLGAWRGAPSRGLTYAEKRAAVRLLATPVRAPETPTERVLVDILADRGHLSRPALVAQAALALYYRELSRGGWLADIGFFGEESFVADVRRALEGARGVLWEIEAPDGCRWDPPPSSLLS